MVLEFLEFCCFTFVNNHYSTGPEIGSHEWSLAERAEEPEHGRGPDEEGACHETRQGVETTDPSAEEKRGERSAGQKHLWVSEKSSVH